MRPVHTAYWLHSASSWHMAGREKDTTGSRLGRIRTNRRARMMKKTETAKRQEKIEAPQGRATTEWESLQTVGDVRRFLRWLILEAKDNRVDRQLAAVLGQLACYSLKTLEIAELANRLAKLEEQVRKKNGATIPLPN